MIYWWNRIPTRYWSKNWYDIPRNQQSLSERKHSASPLSKKNFCEALAAVFPERCVKWFPNREIIFTLLFCISIGLAYDDAIEMFGWWMESIKGELLTCGFSDSSHHFLIHWIRDQTTPFAIILVSIDEKCLHLGGGRFQRNGRISGFSSRRGPRLGTGKSSPVHAYEALKTCAQ